MDDGKGGDYVSLVGYNTDYLKLWYVVTSNITKGTVYRFRYRSKNYVGWSDYSDPSYIQAATVPAKPPAPEYLTSDSLSITLTLSATEDDGGSTVLSYKLLRDNGDDFTSIYSVIVSYD
jgi:hypothetical protein